MTQHYIRKRKASYVASQQDNKRPKMPQHKATSQPIDSRLLPGNPKLLVDVHAASTIWMRNLHLNQFEANMSTRGTQQDLVNLLDICCFRNGFMNVNLRKAIFSFLNRGRNNTSHGVFSKGMRKRLS